MSPMQLKEKKIARFKRGLKRSYPELKTQIKSGERTFNWNIKIIMADSAWAMGLSGEKIILGNMDTGADITHGVWIHESLHVTNGSSLLRIIIRVGATDSNDDIADFSSRGSYPNNDYGWGRVNAFQAVLNTPILDEPFIKMISYDVDDTGGNGNGIAIQEKLSPCMSY